jgi:hypothetical protein
MQKITLQINLSPGDIAYAHLTVPSLIEQHKEIDDVVLIVDVCKPGKTKRVNPKVRFPEPVFSEKVKKIVTISQDICKQYPNTKAYVLQPDDPIITYLGKKYLDGWYYNTHDFGGCANMSYWLGFDMPDTQYVLHYDADILLYQKDGYRWTEKAIQLMNQNESAVAACPRHNTPFSFSDECPSWKHGVYFQKMKDCWLDTWFSTRCLLIDKFRFQKYLPLLTGQILIETLAVKYLNKGYPRSPEKIMFRKIGCMGGGKRLILNDFDSWIIHPHSKPDTYINNLPTIMELVHNGVYPNGHIGDELELDKWLDLIIRMKQ